MNREDFGKLKQMSTQKLRLLLASGLRGDEYKSVLSEYMSRVEKPDARDKKVKTH